MFGRQSRQPFEVLYASEKQIEVDIVAVHGLGSDVDWSWTWRDRKTSGAPVNWLKDESMLPSTVPQARIMVYNYGTRRTWNGPKIRIQSCAEDLVRDLHEFRDGVRDRPLLFIGHSLGGHVVQHALLYADRSDDFRYLPQRTAGFIALGTPFNGTQTSRVIDIAPRLMFLAGSHRGILRDLTHDNQLLQDKLRQFCQLPWSIPVCCFYEQHQTDYGSRFGYPGLIRGLVVPEESACVQGWNRVPLQTEHIKMNKFPSPHDLNFIRVSRAVADMCRRRKIKGRSKSVGYEPVVSPPYRISRQATEPYRRTGQKPGHSCRSS
ncbi:Alpha/Beta hydrolase protein [Thelonectria olida]|uniref:Alpha/Beta hydrolase protein n=1 Tax=Thelonectria olida TaxID=1576542 RepID=A0A9P9AV22_9HYPO|nr:Alpha/Beta hydrolase protein [Thelonectria olida]